MEDTLLHTMFGELPGLEVEASLYKEFGVEGMEVEQMGGGEQGGGAGGSGGEVGGGGSRSWTSETSGRYLDPMGFL